MPPCWKITVLPPPVRCPRGALQYAHLLCIPKCSCVHSQRLGSGDGPSRMWEMSSGLSGVPCTGAGRRRTGGGGNNLCQMCNQLLPDFATQAKSSRDTRKNVLQFRLWNPTSSKTTDKGSSLGFFCCFVIDGDHILSIEWPRPTLKSSLFGPHLNTKFQQDTIKHRVMNLDHLLPFACTV